MPSTSSCTCRRYPPPQAAVLAPKFSRGSWRVFVHADSTDLIPLKVLIAGGFGVGKTTLVRSLSEIPPLLTEQEMTTASVGVDDPGLVPDKTTTTVAMDFGRITVDGSLILYLFGTPGQARFWFMWDELARGSVGAVVLVDLRRVDDCFPCPVPRSLLFSSAVPPSPPSLLPAYRPHRCCRASFIIPFPPRVARLF